VQTNEKCQAQKIVFVMHADVAIVPADGYVPNLIVKSDCAAGICRHALSCMRVCRLALVSFAIKDRALTPDSAAAQIAAAGSGNGVAFSASVTDYKTRVQPLVVLFRLEHFSWTRF